MDGAGAGGAARERRKQLTAAEAVNHKRQLAQMVERELALTGADSVTDFDDALQMVIVETAFGRYPKHLLDVYTGKVVGRQERGDVVKSWQHVEKMSAYCFGPSPCARCRSPQSPSSCCGVHRLQARGRRFVRKPCSTAGRMGTQRR